MATSRTSLLVVLTALMMVLSGCSAFGGGDTSPTATPVDGETPTTTSPSDDPTATQTSDPGSGTATATDTNTPTEGDPGQSLEDPENDVLGWESLNGTGLWYNESIDVDRSDGLNQTELDLVVARGMARVEVVRELEFETSVPVEVISRQQYQEETATRFANVTREDRLHQNVKWEAMLMVDESTDAIAVQQSNQGATVGGYYSPSEKRIVIVSENQESPEMNEITLAQELFHALQDQRFNLSQYNQSTQELHNAVDGIVEGDGNLVDRLYKKRCDAGWDCIEPESGPGGGGSDIHFGQYLVTFQPYSDGPPFVQGIWKSQGWEAVNAVYENPPASTEQVIHPDKYGEDQPADMTFTDTSNDEWRILDLPNGSVNYAEFGEAGLATMLFYPFYDSGRSETPILGIRQFFNVTDSGQVSSFDPINYANEYTAGWDGDRLYPYVTDDSYATNETGYVWKTVWDSEEDAGEFVDGYTQLLDYYGAQSVDGRANTWRIPDGQQYGDAFYVRQTGDTVFIVNAPTVDELSGVREGAGT